MVYVATITTEKSTDITSPLHTSIKAFAGVIYQVEIMFPKGPSGLVGVKIWRANVALYPVDRDEWFIGDGETIRFEDIREMTVSESLIDVFTYNTDTIFDHLIQVRIGVLPVDLYEQRYLPGKSISQLAETFASITDLSAFQPYESDKSILDTLADE